MELQYILQGLRFYLLSSLLVALIPTVIIISITLLMKSSSNWTTIFVYLVAGIIIWCDMAYWSMQGFLIFPFGTDVPMLFSNLFALLGGIVGGVLVHRGTLNYRKNKMFYSTYFIELGYFIFVFIAFSILYNRGMA
jgi:hypothetical protein